MQHSDNIEDLYPLSPMQQGMLFETLHLPGSGVCFEQNIYTVRGALDIQRFARAWERVVESQPVLRTSLLWEDLEEPHQIVHGRGIVDLHTADWRDLSPEWQQRKLDEYLLSERQRGFDLTALPLMRLGLFRIAEEQYRLVWNFHHTILDGWSLPLVMKDVLAAYANTQAGAPAGLPHRRPYRDFIAWLLQQDLTAAEAYWNRRLEGLKEKTPLIVQRRNPIDAPLADDTYQSAFRRVPASVTAALKELSQRYRITLGTAVQCGWALMLGRYAAVDEVVFGCNLSGRPPELPGIEAMVGLFINTLPLRVPTALDTPVLDCLKSIHDQVIDAIQFQFSPLALVQKWSRIPGGQPLFDSLVVIENYPMLESGSSDRQLEIAYQSWTKHSKTGYPLTLLALPDNELLLEIKFDSRLFDMPAAERMLHHLETLLKGIVENPAGRIKDIPLLDDQEKDWLIHHFNAPEERISGSELPADGGATLHGLFEAQAARRPDATALTCDGRPLTYAQLNAQANRLARELARHGVQPDTLVGLCMERSSELVIAILAILKAGGAYLPIDLAYPAERLAFMLEDAQAPVLLTQRKLTGNLPPTQAAVICIEEVLDAAPDDQEPNLPPSSGPDHLAYVIYTSGTTGKPKGSLITHRNVVRLFPSTEHWYQFNERDVWTLFHSCAFDFSVWEIWGALLYGGRIVVVPFLVSRSPEAFYELLAKEQVTVLNQTPSAFRQLIQAEEAVGQKELALRYVIFGGEALEMQSLRPWFDRHGDQTPQLVNMYGITETTVHVTYRPISKDDLTSGSVIGVPIPDLQIYILDAQRQPVPIGVPGEMYVGGAGLARGYLRRPELSGERFIPDHLTGTPGACLYRTGDLARFLPERDIEYLGRIDHQVKIRGFRIELGEIESVLCRHPAIREAVVVAREDNGAKRLVGYLVASQPAPEVSVLREHLKKKLPEYMAPAAFVFLEKLPLTNNGKVDQKALPVPDDQRPEFTARFVEPRTPAEKTLAAIWSKVLRIKQVGINDNFFELGGDSILSIQIVSLARREGLKLTPTLLFTNQTIAELAAGAEAAPAAEVTSEATGDVPLTPIQYWFFEQTLAEPHHYNQAFLFEIAEPIEQAFLEQAFRHVTRHHDALRLRYTRTADGWHQSYGDEGTVPLSWIDLADLDESGRTQQLEETAADLQASLDLGKGPLWRAAYFDSGAGNPGRLLLVIHHLAVDGVSWRPLLEDLESAYHQLKAGQEIQLPAPTASFKSWATQLRKFAATEALQSELPYWKSVTDPQHTLGANGLLLDVNQSLSSNTEASAAVWEVSLSAEETRALLQQIPAVYNTQINDVLLTALARAWDLWSGNRKLFIDLEGHGRENLGEDLDLSRTAGWFTSIFPLLLEVPETQTSWQPGIALKSVKEQLRRIPHRGIGYGILRYLNGNEDLGARPEPLMVFNYLGQFDQVLAGSKMFRFARESSGPWHSLKQTRRHLLELNCWVMNGRLELRWTYSRNLHNAGTIGKLSDEFVLALRELINHCQSPQAGGRTPSDFPLAKLDQPTIDQLVGARRDVEDIYPLSPIQTLFLSANPGAIQSSFDQWQCTLSGPLNIGAFQQAWRETLRRHSILRSTIHSDGLREPVQMVHRAVEPKWTIEDWRESTSGNSEERWSGFLKQDRSQPLVLTEAPVMRFALVRLADQRWKFLWSIPALLLDGWSWPIVFREASQLYSAFSEGAIPKLEPVRPYRDYIEWLSSQLSTSEARQFWQNELAGFREPTPLPAETPQWDGTGDRYGQHTVPLALGVTRELQATARKLQITLNTLVQGAWAILLRRQSARADVVFGAAFSGRPAELRSVESIAGPFVNNLPVRVADDGSATAGEFLRRLHTHLLQMNPHQFTPLMEIQSGSEMPWRYRLFDSLVVFQNYQVDESARSFGAQIKIADFAGPIHTNYPVLLLAEPETELRLTLIFDRQNIASKAAERWGRDLAILLEQLPLSLDRRIGGLEALLSPPPTGTPIGQKLRRRAQNYVPPQTDMERTIVEVWEKMFGLQQIGIEENFFDLGGHSLLLVQMHGALRTTLKTGFPVVTLFEHPTVRSLARHLTQPAVSSSETGRQWRTLAEKQKRALGQLRTKFKK